jgi:uncharacterized protein YkwD
MRFFGIHSIKLIAGFLSLLLIVMTLVGCGLFSTGTVTFPIPTSSTAVQSTLSTSDRPSTTVTNSVVPSFTPTVLPSTTTISSTTPNVTVPPLPTLTASPAFIPYIPEGTQAELFQYMLDLINQDRQNAGLQSVVLAYNAAAQKHAQDMLDHYFISHWGTDGLKPYMRYTLEGGVNYEQENSAYSGFQITDNPENYPPLNAREELKGLEFAMMSEVPPNDGHRLNILNKIHTKVNLGIASDGKRIALVQQFEGEYVEFTLPPVLTGTLLSLSGRFTLGNINNVAISYDPTPQPLTTAELLSGPHTYSLGSPEGFIIPPPPPGQYYTNLSPEAILASHWEVDAAGQFRIQADIAPALARGSGVYTVSIIVLLGEEAQHLTNYSIFVN